MAASRPSWSVSWLLLFLSFACFLLATFGVHAPIDLIALGLALFVAGHQAW